MIRHGGLYRGLHGLGYTLLTSAPFSLSTNVLLLQLVLTNFATSEFFHQIRCTTLMERNASLTWHRKVVLLVYMCFKTASRNSFQAEAKITVYRRCANSKHDNCFHPNWPWVKKSLHFEWISNIRKNLSLKKITWFNSQLKQTRKHIRPLNQLSKKTRAKPLSS